MTSPATEPALLPILKTELNRLRQLNTLDIQGQWQWHNQDTEIVNISPDQTQQWAIVPLNDRQHIAWESGQKVRWLCQTITVPQHFYGYPLAGMILRLALTWWADDAQIYVNKALVQSGDLFECFTRLCLSSSVQSGDSFEIAIRLVSPGHDDGALVRSQLIYELPATQPTPEPSFIADELTVLATLEPTTQPNIQTALQSLNWESLSTTAATEPNTDALNIWKGLYNTGLSDQRLPAAATIHPFQQSLSQLRRTLHPLTEPLKQRTIECVGHAHLDMAWLWPIADTWDAAERTFNSVLNLQKDFPNLTYTHSSPALFEWIEHNRPDLFQQIQQKVKEGTWTIDAGLWIEPEFNIISGESIARHILYGQRYCQQKFGTISKVAWLPDSFGFCWQLPQLLTQGGIETFATLKLSWNDTTQFPHQLFWWQSPDGTRIRALMLPPIGTDIDPIKMSTHAANWENNTQIPNTLWLPGLGDHGGGPTRDMLEKADRWEKSPFFPNLRFTNPGAYINDLALSQKSSISNRGLSGVEAHNNELYLELHRGCYTTHADQKQQNRCCEDLLYKAEVFATIAQLTAEQPYPKSEIEGAWKKLLFNQFHDILPGTAIPEVFVDADKDWKQVEATGRKVLQDSLSAIASTINLPTPPHTDAKAIIIFNSLAYPRSAVITIPIPESSPGILSFNWEIFDTSNAPIPHQTSFRVRAERGFCDLSFLANNLPALGYQCFWLCPGTQRIEHTTPEHYILENEFLKATIDPTTGHIASLIEKSTNTETFRAPGNQLQAFTDKGQYWDAWNIDPDYEKHPLPSPNLKHITWFEYGPVRQQLRVTYQFQQSTIDHYYTLYSNAPYLEVKNHIDWQETQVLLKTNFPLTVSAPKATYEMPFGSITRTTQPKTEAEKAKWEVPALRWADLGNQAFGTSILTQYKHGFDASPNHLRLTLLKSPIWPDPQADKGHHNFSYAIYPHPGTWQTARTVQHARSFNIRPTAYQLKKTNNPAHSKNPPTHSFLQIHNPNIILSTLKPSEDNPSEFILRCYEGHGDNTKLQTQNSLPLTGLTQETANCTNLLEATITSEQPIRIEPCKISTFRLRKAQLNN